MNRKNDKGVWAPELYTKRDFEALQIQLAPYSSQLKESHLMTSGNAVLTLPKQGRGAHESNGTLALDGRTRRCIARAGALGEEQHAESLYWLVARSSEKKDCNLEYYNAAWEMQNTITLPGPAGPASSVGPVGKKRKMDTKTTSWSNAELPMIPLLVNNAKIAKHTLLCVYQKEKEVLPKKQ